MLRIRNLAALAVLTLTNVASAQPVATGTSFFEPFDRLDERRWYVSDGWTNGNHQGCTWLRQNARVSKGLLTLKLDDTRNRHRALGCAEVQTRKTFGYGLYEVRMQTAVGAGLNTAIFTYSGPPNYNVHDEIDFEFLGKSPDAVQLNYFVAGKGGRESFVPAPGASCGFHTYAFEWSAAEIRWYIDGKLVRVAALGDRPRVPGKLFLTLWSGSAGVNDWLGSFSYSGAPVTATIDWVAYTAPGERCRFAQSLHCARK